MGEVQEILSMKINTQRHIPTYKFGVIIESLLWKKMSPRSNHQIWYQFHEKTFLSSLWNQFHKKKIHFFREINFAKNTYLFFRLRLYMISWIMMMLILYEGMHVPEISFSLKRFFFIKFNFFANKLRSNYLIFSTLIK